MKLTNIELLQSFDALKQLGQMDLPVKASFAIASVLTKVDAAVKVVTAEREKLIGKYAKTGDDGKMIVGENGTVTITDTVNFSAGINELMACEVDLDVGTITPESLGEKVEPKPVVLATLNWLFKE